MSSTVYTFTVPEGLDKKIFGGFTVFSLFVNILLVGFSGGFSASLPTYLFTSTATYSVFNETTGHYDATLDVLEQYNAAQFAFSVFVASAVVDIILLLIPQLRTILLEDFQQRCNYRLWADAMITMALCQFIIVGRVGMPDAYVVWLEVMGVMAAYALMIMAQMFSDIRHVGGYEYSPVGEEYIKPRNSIRTASVIAMVFSFIVMLGTWIPVFIYMDIMRDVLSGGMKATFIIAFIFQFLTYVHAFLTFNNVEVWTNDVFVYFIYAVLFFVVKILVVFVPIGIDLSS